MITKLRLIIVLSIIALLCSCSHTTARHHPNCKELLQQKKSVVILPPNVTVNTLDISGKKQRVHGYEDHLEKAIHTKILKAVEKRGFKAKLLSKKDIYDKDIADKVSNLKKAYNTTLNTKLYKEHLMDRKHAHSTQESVGQSAIDLGKLTNSDLIFITDYSKVIKSSGAKTRDFVVSLLIGRELAGEVYVMIVGIIDAKNGSVLWTNNNGFQNGVISFNIGANEKKDDKELDHIISHNLKDLDELLVNKP